MCCILLLIINSSISLTISLDALYVNARLQKNLINSDISAGKKDKDSESYDNGAIGKNLCRYGSSTHRRAQIDIFLDLMNVARRHMEKSK